MGCVAALLCLGADFESLDGTSSERIMFVITSKESWQEKALDYYSGRLMVSARTMHFQIKFLKGKIIEYRQKNPKTDAQKNNIKSYGAD